MQVDLLTGIFGISALIAAAISGLIWGNTKALRDSNRDLRDRVADLEADRARDRAGLEALTSENKMLKDLVTGEVHWQSISDGIQDHNREAREYWAHEQEQTELQVRLLRELVALQWGSQEGGA